MATKVTKTDATRRSLRSLGQYTVGGGIAVLIVAVLEGLLNLFGTGDAVTVQQMVTVVGAILFGAFSSYVQRRLEGAKLDPQSSNVVSVLVPADSQSAKHITDEAITAAKTRDNAIDTENIQARTTRHDQV